jgi:hypothetical protein
MVVILLVCLAVPVLLTWAGLVLLLGMLKILLCLCSKDERS